MSVYSWRKNYISIYSKGECLTRGKMAIKTTDTRWIGSKDSVVVLVSVQSNFHEEVSGDLKMEALVSTIKNCVEGPVTVLFSDIAHLQTVRLRYDGNVDKAFEDCLTSAYILNERYLHYFKNCKVVFWHSYICQDSHFLAFKNLIKELFQTDSCFNHLLLTDAELTYHGERLQLFPNKKLYIEKTIDDLIEQCASILVLANKGYRFQFYPGSPFKSVEYVARTFLEKDKQLNWINVFISIEKKTVYPSNKHLA